MKKIFTLNVNGKLHYELIFEKLFFILLIFTFILGLLNKNSFTYLSSLLTLAVSLLIKLIFMYTKFKFSMFLYFLSQLFIFLSMFLGRIVSIYSIFPYWDKLVHFYSGIILFLIGLDIFFNMCKNNTNSNLALFILFGIFFSISMAGLWEIYEFTTDIFFKLNSQNNSLKDTMLDMICGSSSAIISSIIYIFHYKYKNHNSQNKI